MRLICYSLASMPIIKSAKKRARTARKATVRNAKTKRSMRSALKAFTKSPSAKTFSAGMSEIDTAAKKHVIHKNKAARMKQRLSAEAKTAGVKQTASAKKAAAKPAAKKASSKPATAKKAPAKKPAAKK